MRSQQSPTRPERGLDFLCLAAWVAAVGAVLIYLGYFGLIGRMFEHWFLMGLLALVGLMIAGQLGAGLGLPTLFRDDPDKPVWDVGRSFLSGLGVTLLVVLCCTIVYYCEWLSHFDRLVAYDQTFREWKGEDPPVPSTFPYVTWRSFFGPPSWLPPYDARPGEVFLPEVRYVLLFPYNSVFLRFVAIASAPLLMLLALCVALPTPEVSERRLAGRRGRAAQVAEYLGYALGALAATGVVLAAAVLGHVASNLAILRADGAPAAARGLSPLLRLSNTLAEHDYLRAAAPALYEIIRDNALFINTSMWIFVVLYFAIYSAVLGSFRVSPGLGICMVFSLMALGYFLLMMLAPNLRFFLVGGVAVGAMLLNSGAYKYRFPGLAAAYAAPADLHAADDRVDVKGDLPSGPGLIDDRAALDAWAGRWGRPGAKPKLVLVTVSGGAYRASFWTTVVLENLAATPGLDGFLNHIRLMTGASGGMVGAAYVAALLTEPPEGGYSAPVEATRRLAEDSGRDSLTPVVQRLLRRDLPKTFWPFAQSLDRGITLEDQWRCLDIPFAALRRGEERGWRPSLVVSPMIVETGRRLLFSNLDLYGLTETQARLRDEVSAEPQDDGLRPPTGGQRRYSRSAVEFFRALPDAYCPGGAWEEGFHDLPPERWRDSFKIKTAVRMNASFPYITPAVSLPVDPPRRVVDAGYYDNYGVNLAANWAYQNRRWIRENTSGLALIQVRAYANEAVRKRLWVPIRDVVAGPTDTIFRRLSRGLEWATSPPEGGLAALNWSMSYRNDEQLRILDDAFNTRYDVVDGTIRTTSTRERGEPGFFETFIFENPIPFGMNWFVTEDEVSRMKESLDSGRLKRPEEQRACAHNRREKDLLLRWWSR